MSPSPPTTVPTINPVAAPPTASPTPPETPQALGTFFHASRSNQSPGNNLTGPALLPKSPTLLQTPPIFETQSRQDRRSYFSSKGPRLTSRKNYTESPDNQSAHSLSPGLSSGGSFHSSDTGQSPCSYSSGELLSPPQFQGDDDKPPYVPRRSSSDSLTMMMQKVRRAETIPNDKKIRAKRLHRRRHGCRHHRSKKQEQHHTCWGEFGCSVAPTAPIGEKQLCRDHTGQFIPRYTQHGNTDTFGRLMPRSMPGPAPPVITRRWSSVEVGAHQINLQSTLPTSVSMAVATKGSGPGDEENRFFSENIGRPYRSSTFTRDAINRDIVRAIRERLTVRKVATDQFDSPVEPPLSITLRRASGVSSFRGHNARNARLSRSFADRDDHSGGNPGGTTPMAHYQDLAEQEVLSAAYLITSEDIESITLLITEHFGPNRRSYSQDQILQDKIMTAPSCRDSPTSTTSGERTAQPTMPPTKPTINSIGFQPTSLRNFRQSDYLKVDDLQQPIQKSGSNRSEHEVIWDGSRRSTTSFGSSIAEGNMKYRDTLSEFGASPEACLGENQNKSAADKGDAFDPRNARASINEWSWRLSQNDIAMAVTSSDSDSADITPRAERVKTKSHPPLRSVASTPKERIAPRVRPFPRYAASHEQLQDVVSFPPLSTRKATSEWFSPLPAMETTSTTLTPPLMSSRSLYGLGVDVTIGPSGSAISKAPFISWVRSADVSPSHSPGIEFRPDYGFGDLDTHTRMDDSRRKSVVKPHPKATARTGQSFAMGSSIGIHSSERRRSSVPRIQRVRTIDNIHKGERDEPASRWRPPSICPPRFSPSQLSPDPVEPEEPEERRSEERVPEMMTRLQRLRSGITDRISLVEAKSPPLPKTDCVGIYGAITGTLRKSIASTCEDDISRHECDDCAKDPRNPSIDWIG